MIVLRNKCFVSRNLILNNPRECAEIQGKGVLIELIKAIEFYDRESNMKHWLLEEIVGKYFKEAVSGNNLITDCLIRGEEFSVISKRVGAVSSSGVRFIESVFNLFAPGKEQYRKYAPSYKNELDNLCLGVDFYKRVLKYISLVFAGQISPDQVDFWDPIVDRTKVNYDSRDPLNTAITKDTEILLLKCIVSIKGYSTAEINRLMH